MTLPRAHQVGLAGAIKRTVDLTAAAVGLVATAPLLAGASAAVLATMGRPIFFRQQRPGLHGRPFQIVKFRTMSNQRGPDGELLPDAQRLTPVGRVLRATSIDELPQLWNVLRGELSLVGPRPLLMRYLDRYTPTQARRHEVKPGITGWAQVNGRNAIGWDEKFALDVWYVDHWSLALDAYILGRTVLGVVQREGISARGHETMPEFLGAAAANADPSFG